jgi:hypothetical protein
VHGHSLTYFVDIVGHYNRWQRVWVDLMGSRLVWWVIFLGLIIAVPVSAQDDSPIITARNIRQLRSVLHVDSGSWIPKVERGWFTLSLTGDLIAVVDRGERVITVDANNGKPLNSYSVVGQDGLPATFLDAAFSADSQFLTSVHVDGVSYYVAYRPLDAETPTVARVLSSDVPLRVWANQHVWLEMIGSSASSEHYILQTEYPADGNIVDVADWSKLPSGPENDPDSFLRVGRIAPPVAITETQDFLVKRWNLQTGEVAATSQIDSLIGAGQVSADGNYLAWIDQGFEAVHLLNFETGEDRVVAPLNGTYIPFLLLTSEADVIIGVNVALEPSVVAWDTATGEQIRLGDYRSCNRQPDMVRLSRDGTTLVVGCDTGLDIWRIK